jgi:hypothetical protein
VSLIRYGYQRRLVSSSLIAARATDQVFDLRHVGVGGLPVGFFQKAKSGIAEHPIRLLAAGKGVVLASSGPYLAASDALSVPFSSDRTFIK